jgi:hypothetical protein
MHERGLCYLRAALRPLTYSSRRRRATALKLLPSRFALAIACFSRRCGTRKFTRGEVPFSRGGRPTRRGRNVRGSYPASASAEIDSIISWVIRSPLELFRLAMVVLPRTLPDTLCSVSSHGLATGGRDITITTPRVQSHQPWAALFWEGRCLAERPTWVCRRFGSQERSQSDLAADMLTNSCCITPIISLNADPGRGFVGIGKA